MNGASLSRIRASSCGVESPFPLDEAYAFARANDSGLREFMTEHPDALVVGSLSAGKSVSSGAAGLLRSRVFEHSLFVQDPKDGSAHRVELVKERASIAGRNVTNIRVTLSQAEDFPVVFLDPREMPARFVSLASARSASDDLTTQPWSMTSVTPRSVEARTPLVDRYHYVFRYADPAPQSNGGFSLGIPLEVVVDAATGRLVKLDVPVLRP